MADIKDLLVRLSLDAASWKTSVADCKSELQTLKSEFKAVNAEEGVSQAGATLLQNLKDQKTATDELIASYQKGITALQGQLNNVDPGSKRAQELQQQINGLETAMNNAKTSASNLQTQINSFKIDTFVTNASNAASAINSLKLGLGQILGMFGQTADEADNAFVSRQAALTEATRPIPQEQKTEEVINGLDQGLQDLAQHAPVAYEGLAAIMGAGAQQGVAVENLMEFTRVMAMMNAATDVTGTEGAQNMARFMAITNESTGSLERVGSVLDVLGNSVAASQAEILDFGLNAAPALHQVGMSSTDIMAVSAAMRALGINSAAGGTSIGKLGTAMDNAAKLGASQMQPMLENANKAYGQQFDTVYDLQRYYDSLGRGDKAKLWEAMGMTKSDAENIMEASLAAENFASVMGTDVATFADNWNADAAQSMLDFFKALGELDNSDLENNLNFTLDKLGISDVRQLRAVKAMTSQWELYATTLQTARTEAESMTTLATEAETAYSTVEAQRQMNENKAQNAAQAMGETVTAMRQPFEDFFSDLKQWYADWPGWAQTSVAAATEVMGGMGDILNTAGTLSFNVLNIATAIQKLNQTGLGAKLLTGAAAAGKGVAAAGAAGAAVAGIIVLATTLKNMQDSTAAISENLSNLQISVDEGSKNAALEAINEVKAASDALKGGNTESYENTSKVVQMGYGTASMFGTALAYEQAKGEKTIEDIYSGYGAKIREAEQELLSATDESSRAAAQQKIESLTTAMQSEVQAAEKTTSDNINAVLNGAIERTGQKENLEKVGQQYNALQNLFTVWGEWKNDPNAVRRSGALDSMNEVLSQMGIQLMDGMGNPQFNAAISQLYGQIGDTMAEVAQDGELGSILSTAITSGAIDGSSELDGAILGLLQGMDIVNIGQQGAETWKDIGRLSMGGLADGVTGEGSALVSAVQGSTQGMIDAAKSVLGIHSPSTVFAGIGENTVQGFAQGITAQISTAVSAMAALGAAVTAEARKQAAAIRAAMTVVAPAPRYAAGNTGGNAGTGGGNTTNNTNININTNNVNSQTAAALARQIAAAQRRSTYAVGG